MGDVIEINKLKFNFGGIKFEILRHIWFGLVIMAMPQRKVVLLLFIIINGICGLHIPQSPSRTVPRGGAISPPISSLARAYGELILTNPIITKSITAGSIFALSDVTAQALENKLKVKKEEIRNVIWKWKRGRTATNFLIGLCYFGPAAHFWYGWVFSILPSRSLPSTLGKASLGQVIFGPLFNILFFAVILFQSSTLTPSNLAHKIKVDLPGVLKSGAMFWPVVDIISYRFVAVKWIPLFINLMSFVWTIYLSLVANNNSNSNKQPLSSPPPNIPAVE